MAEKVVKVGKERERARRKVVSEGKSRTNTHTHRHFLYVPSLASFTEIFWSNGEMAGTCSTTNIGIGKVLPLSVIWLLIEWLVITIGVAHAVTAPCAAAAGAAGRTWHRIGTTSTSNTSTSSTTATTTNRVTRGDDGE